MGIKKARYVFEQLDAWQLAMELSKTTYQITAAFPARERYALTDQLCRAASSVPLNIAEGKGRYHSKDFLRFLLIARGSLYETITILYLAQSLNYLPAARLQELLNLCDRVLSKLTGLIHHLQSVKSK